MEYFNKLNKKFKNEKTLFWSYLKDDRVDLKIFFYFIISLTLGLGMMVSCSGRGRVSNVTNGNETNTPKLINEAVGKYYKDMNKLYNNKFSNFFKEQKYAEEQLEEELTGTYEDNGLIDFDKNFPFTKEENSLNKEKKQMRIHEILQNIYNNPDGSYKKKEEPKEVEKVETENNDLKTLNSGLQAYYAYLPFTHDYNNHKGKGKFETWFENNKCNTSDIDKELDINTTSWSYLSFDKNFRLPAQYNNLTGAARNKKVLEIIKKCYRGEIKQWVKKEDEKANSIFFTNIKSVFKKGIGEKILEYLSKQEFDFEGFADDIDDIDDNFDEKLISDCNCTLPNLLITYLESEIDFKFLYSNVDEYSFYECVKEASKSINKENENENKYSPIDYKNIIKILKDSKQFNHTQFQSFTKKTFSAIFNNNITKDNASRLFKCLQPLSFHSLLRKVLNTNRLLGNANSPFKYLQPLPYRLLGNANSLFKYLQPLPFYSLLRKVLNTTRNYFFISRDRADLLFLIEQAIISINIENKIKHKISFDIYPENIIKILEDSEEFDHVKFRSFTKKMFIKLFANLFINNISIGNANRLFKCLNNQRYSVSNFSENLFYCYVNEAIVSINNNNRHKYSLIDSRNIIKILKDSKRFDHKQFKLLTKQNFSAILNNNINMSKLNKLYVYLHEYTSNNEDQQLNIYNAEEKKDDQ
ncbi:MAG: hypothetical protein GY830_06715 [Bacteroidetes bacterium]|nr:hypothetical protein [Bacteroidota bacterium]